VTASCDTRLCVAGVGWRCVKGSLSEKCRVSWEASENKVPEIGRPVTQQSTRRAEGRSGKSILWYHGRGRECKGKSCRDLRDL